MKILDIREAVAELEDGDLVHRLGGAIGILTKGRLTRKEYTKQAIITALMHLENPELYKK